MYSQCNDLCSYKGNAYTSNAKFLLPNNPVYNLNSTDMMLFPGHTGFLPPSIPYPCNVGPESIKAWEKHNCGVGKEIPKYIKKHNLNFRLNFLIH